ncbi:HEAT repeat domain-containing protein [Stieleria sp. TO1_6]|uniref:HEAT repeat domain-containing protein n=1 Tax=Stieleria tagensis TaxID=2956795 RepID=UPI00209AD17F|nr:HEAT repeat domain-containing protein [Stieleria tagensis]MCO8120108.1 HEAT repeat domain-containing protein [Stieleria tagensis]
MDEQQNLRSGDAGQRAEAAESLSQMGPDAGFAAVELVQACGDDEAVAQFAVAALEDMGPPPAETLASVAELMTSDQSEVAYWAITLVGRCGVAARDHQDALASLVTTSTEINVRQRAVWALGKIEARSDTALQALRLAAADSDARLSRLAGEALAVTQT